MCNVNNTCNICICNNITPLVKSLLVFEIYKEVFYLFFVPEYMGWLNW